MEISDTVFMLNQEKEEKADDNKNAKLRKYHIAVWL